MSSSKMKANKSFTATVGVTVVLLGWLTQPALSFGERGAAERVVGYSAYVLEEIYPSSQYRIAKGCTPRAGGGRDNLQTGGPRRCTFGEFCEHLWMQTKPGDVKPTDVDWGKFDNDMNPRNQDKNTAEDLVRRIMSQVTMKDPNGGRKLLRGSKLPGQGFQGAADGAKLGLPPLMSPVKDNIVNWYAALEHCGSRIEDAKEEFDNLTPEERNRMGINDDVFKKWLGNAKDGSELLYDLRQYDHWKFMYGQGKLDQRLGVSSAYDTRTSRFNTLNNKAWREMNIPDTIQLFQGNDLAEKSKNFNEKWDPIRNEELYKDHMTAMASVKRIKEKLAGC